MPNPHKPFWDEDKVKGKIGLLDFVRYILPYLKKHWLSIALIFTVMLSLNFASRLLPTIFGWAIDFGILKNDLTYIRNIAFAYLALEVLRTILMFTHTYLFQRLGNRILYSVREDLISHVQSLPVSYFDRNPIGRIVTRVTNDVQGMADLFNQGLVTIITNLISILSITIAMALISWKLCIISLFTAPVIYFIIDKINQKIIATFREARKRLAEINSFVAENINGMKVIQLYNRVQRNDRQFFSLSENYKSLQIRSVYLYGTLWPVLHFFNASTIVAALYFGGWLKSMDEIQIGALIAFFMHVQDFHTPLRQMLEKYVQFQNSLTSAERIVAVLEQKSESGITGKKHLLSGAINFSGLHFRYREHTPWVLQDINLQINPGESVALVGPTGCGKSTMVALLQRFYEIECGEILLDGIPIQSIAKQDLRRQIGVVQQDPFLFRGTIGENIHLHDPTISHAKVLHAIQLARCHQLLERHGGLNGSVEERGNNLSSGEKQMIAFARILAFDPKILILDEATSNIDSESEEIIQKAVQEVMRNRTSILIAHRLSTILNCNKIVTLQKGKIEEIGTHEQLLARKGLYYSLYRAYHPSYEDNSGFTVFS